MLCDTCQEIFSSERWPKLDGSYSQHLYCLADLMQSVRRRCFICAVLKRAISRDGKVDKPNEHGEIFGFVVKYMMTPGMGDLVELSFKFRYGVSSLYFSDNRHITVHPWNGTNSIHCDSFTSDIYKTPADSSVFRTHQGNSLNRHRPFYVICKES